MSTYEMKNNLNCSTVWIRPTKDESIEYFVDNNSNMLSGKGEINFYKYNRITLSNIQL